MAKELNEKDGDCAGRGFDVRALRDRLVLLKGGELLNSSFVMIDLRITKIDLVTLTIKKPTKTSQKKVYSAP